MDFLNRPVANYGTSAWICGLIRCMRLPDPNVACRSYVEQETGPDIRNWFEPSTPYCPAWYAVRFDDRCLVVIDGASSLDQLTRLVAGYTGILQSGWRDPDNDYLQNAANGIVQTLQSKSMSDTQKWTLAGWSLGGAIAPLLPVNQAVRSWFENFVEVVSFGSPRPGGESVARGINSWVRLTRYMNDTDPIPLSPPRVDLMPSLPLIIGIRPAQRWTQFVQPRGGLQIAFDGTITDVPVPTSGLVSFPLSLAAWMWGFYTNTDNTHAIQVYANRLLINAARRDNHTVPNVAAREELQPVRRADMNRAERQAEQAVIDIEQRQNAAPQIIPRESIAQVQKVQKMYYVTLRGTPVMSGRNKRKAYAVKNELNRMLERLQTAAMVDTVNFGAEFQRYLDDAADPAGGFSPVMSTDWNLGQT